VEYPWKSVLTEEEALGDTRARGIGKKGDGRTTIGAIEEDFVADRDSIPVISESGLRSRAEASL